MKRIATVAVVGFMVVGLAAARMPVARSTTCSLKWRLSVSPRAPGATLNDVTVLSNRSAWAVGSTYPHLWAWAPPSLRPVKPVRPLVERWNGRRWKVAATPASATGVLSAVAASSSRDVWAVGYSFSPDPLIEHFDGKRWSAITTSVDETANSFLSGITVLSPSDAWAVGGTAIPPLPTGRLSPWKPLIMHWDGRSWSTVPAPSAPARAPLGAVAAASPDDVWAVGPADLDTEGGPDAYFVPPVADHWDGRTWRVVRIGALNDLLDIVASSAMNVWAVGGSEGTAQSQAVEHWNGHRWSNTDFHDAGGFAAEGYLTGVAATSPRDVWAVGDDVGIYGDITHWDGKRWKWSSHPGGLALFGIAAASARSVWAVGSTRKGAAILHYSCR